MNPVTAVVVFAIIWWTVLMLVLPFGVRTSAEEGKAGVPGQASSAPHRPQIRRKMLWTTGISAALFGLFALNLRYGWVTLEDFPGPFRDVPAHMRNN